MALEFTINDISSLAAFVTAIVGVYIASSTRKKIRNEAAESITSSALALISPLEKRIKELNLEIESNKGKLIALKDRIILLEETVKELRKENEELRLGIEILTKQVISLGQQPIYRLKER